eukprot:CAMPEP_0197904466 /NCGR_PEP_ID=MMETSP1439-20131203/58147_1 /TAXON_ID=66791 /ORGANISM="Gonyaulax spinifera, Strain CCMP409" /LENGTH=113 /DNA_ID=CAMNT_0043525661 /DNA_START=214 /DNA_END=552 /DNA_ORIENTATION=+
MGSRASQKTTQVFNVHVRERQDCLRIAPFILQGGRFALQGQGLLARPSQRHGDRAPQERSPHPEDPCADLRRGRLDMCRYLAVRRGTVLVLGRLQARSAARRGHASLGAGRRP